MNCPECGAELVEDTYGTVCPECGYTHQTPEQHDREIVAEALAYGLGYEQ